MSAYILETEYVRTTITPGADGRYFSYRVEYRQGEGPALREVGQVLGTPAEHAATGGTRLYCPSCRTLRQCAVVDGTSLTGRRGRHWRKLPHPDLQWLRRARQCRTCFYRFLTAEVQEAFLDELVRLRDAIASGRSLGPEDLAQFGPNVVAFRRRGAGSGEPAGVDVT